MKQKLFGLITGLMIASAGFSAEDKTSQWSAEQLFAEAKKNISEDNCAQAIKHLKNLETRYPFDERTKGVPLLKAFCNKKENEIDDAVAEIDRFLNLYPHDPDAAYAYYLKALIFLREDDQGLMSRLIKRDLSEYDLNALKKSFDLLKMLVERYSDSLYVADALQKMRRIVLALAKHDLEVARFYFAKAAYLAALNRAQNVIQEHFDTPYLEPALVLSVQAYQRMGLSDLQADQERVLCQSFPDNKLCFVERTLKK